MTIHKDRIAGTLKMFPGDRRYVDATGSPDKAIHKGIENDEKIAMLKARWIERQRPIRRQRPTS